MPTLVRDPQPVEFEALLERRRRLGQDLFDEVWKGVLHMNPAPHSQHGRLEWQLAGILAPLAASAGLRALGQFKRRATTASRMARFCARDPTRCIRPPPRLYWRS